MLEVIAASEAESRAEEFRATGAEVHLLDGSSVRDKDTLLAAAPGSFPMPEGVTPRGWQGFEDYLWEGVVTAGAPAVAIVWTDAQEMLNGGLADLLTAVDVVQEVARRAAGLDTPVEVTLLLAGTGPNFPG